jgi:hypothetical protein
LILAVPWIYCANVQFTRSRRHSIIPAAHPCLDEHQLRCKSVRNKKLLPSGMNGDGMGDHVCPRMLHVETKVDDGQGSGKLLRHNDSRPPMI